MNIFQLYRPRETAADVRATLFNALKAAAFSYGVFDQERIGASRREGISKKAMPLAYSFDNISPGDNRAIPHFFIRGKNITLLKDTDVQIYADALKAAGLMHQD